MIGENEAEAIKLPRVTTFAASAETPVSPDYYCKALPMISRANAAFDIVIASLMVITLLGVCWLAFGAHHDDAYISDGILGCQAKSVVIEKARKGSDGSEDRRT